MREARGRRVTTREMANFSGRIIGTKAGREFAAFLVYKDDLEYDVNKILDGTERPPEAGMRKETYHILMQSIFKALEVESKKYKEGDDVPLEEYYRAGHAIQWILKFQELENQLNALNELAAEIPFVEVLITDPDFADTCCPELNDFIDSHSDIINDSLQSICSIAK